MNNHNKYSRMYINLQILEGHEFHTILLLTQVLVMWYIRRASSSNYKGTFLIFLGFCTGEKYIFVCISLMLTIMFSHTLFYLKQFLG